MSTPTLRTEALGKRWGLFDANRNVNLTLQPGMRHALIGPNGAGKTTLINLLTGAIPPTTGRVLLDGQDITRLPQHLRVRRGMSRTFQITTLFPGLTVLQSVLLAILERKGLHRRMLCTVASLGEEVREAQALLATLKLAREADTPTRTLAYGRQRLVEIAVALATRPRVLLLDEPAAGIPTAESAELFEVIAALPREVTILFIEHDMDLVFRFAEQITVMTGGQILCEGAPDQIASDPRVREAYLGESADA